jgi:hypothetical protein
MGVYGLIMGSMWNMNGNGVRGLGMQWEFSGFFYHGVFYMIFFMTWAMTYR